MPVIAVEAGNYRNFSASGLVSQRPGQLMGVFVASASATPTIKFWDNTSAAAPLIVNTFTPVAGTFYPIPVQFTTGLFITISGTVDCTVVVTEGIF